VSAVWRPGFAVPDTAPGDLVITGANVLLPDGTFGGVAAVEVKDGRFGSLDTHVAPWVIDARGLWLTPGFVDVHTHVAWHEFDPVDRAMLPPAALLQRTGEGLQRTLRAGITGVRDAGGFGLELGRALSTLGEPLPTVTRSVAILGAGDARGERHLRGRVGELAEAGAQWIKVAATGGVGAAGRRFEPVFTRGELRALTGAAERAGLPVMVHAWGGDALTWALEFGARSIEHAVFLSASQAKLAASTGAVVVPTVWIYRDVLALATAGVLPGQLVGPAGLAVAAHPAAVAECLNAGVSLAMGTDAGMDHQHGANLHEVAAMIDIGVPPSTALVAATRGGAALLGHHDRGTVAPGQVADFVLFDRDPSLPGVLRDRGAVVAVALAGHLVHAR